MSEGQRGQRMHPNKSASNFQRTRLAGRGEFGRTGRYKPGGAQNSPGRKSGKPDTRTPIRVKEA
jgi:hypothetical protein